MASRVGTMSHAQGGVRASSTSHSAWLFQIYGTVRDKSGVLVSGRGVRAIRESDQVCVAYVESDAQGEWALELNEPGPFTLVFSKEPDRNALVYSGIAAE